MISSGFFELIHETCLPGVWSKGVALARAGRVSPDHKGATDSGSKEISLKVTLLDRPISHRVTLWPSDSAAVDADWYCDCEDRNEVCAHVAASVIALKAMRPGAAVSAEGELPGLESAAIRSGRKPLSELAYHFVRISGRLGLERRIMPENKPLSAFLVGSLVSYVGGVKSGRIQGPEVASTQADFAVDGLLHRSPVSSNGPMDRSTLVEVLKLLSGNSNCDLDGQKIVISSRVITYCVIVRDEGDGYRMQLRPSVETDVLDEVFANGAAICSGLLRPIDAPLFDGEERKLLAGTGTYFGPGDERRLVLDLLPPLEKKILVQKKTERLPVRKLVTPRIEFKMDQLGENLHVTASVGHEEVLGLKEVGWTDPVETKALVQKLKQELQLVPGQMTKFEGEDAGGFLARLKIWRSSGGLKDRSPTKNDLQGVHLIPLVPRIQFEDSRLSVDFGSGADSARVLQAWRENQHTVPLLQGGWGQLPQDWLNRYGEQVLDLLAAQGERQGKAEPKPLPPYLVPQVADLCDAIGQSYPDSMGKLRSLLDGEAQAKQLRWSRKNLPKDLKATLRQYQEDGVRWLSLLKKAGVGALLADDMGLGKTLQALCTIEKGTDVKTLIVAPTSVLHSWLEQIQLFRPSLKVDPYWGSNRKLVFKGDVILTSYAILRLDRAQLAVQAWDTIILDEAQTIKNPESQVAQAAFSLNGKFKIALSGTPIENRSEDLWSQFQFLNPGLLGSRVSVKERSSEDLRKRIKPFLLRRLKKDVAPELPPKTEIVLTCELSTKERELYDTILISARKEALETLETGASVFGVLEMLLRLRQACCHAALVPGGSHAVQNGRSSKVDLLLETLEESVGLGHRALVFSQWTSYLDLIEPALKSAGISFGRLDGSTKDRQGVVSQFQNPNGPSVLLISLKAGGVGLTLTAADHIFLMDPWWNPTVEDQATGRAHRIGQTQPVLIHRLVAQNTLEERILELQKAKSQFAEQVLSGSGGVPLTRKELLDLLS